MTIDPFGRTYTVRRSRRVLLPGRDSNIFTPRRATGRNATIAVIVSIHKYEYHISINIYFYKLTEIDERKTKKIAIGLMKNIKIIFCYSCTRKRPYTIPDDHH